MSTEKESDINNRIEIIPENIKENQWWKALTKALRKLSIMTPTTTEAGTELSTLTDDRHYINLGLMFLLITLGIFSIWAGFVPLSSAVVSSGEVVVTSYRKSIQHYEGGVIENILVSDGDIVAAGDPLIQLETIQSEAQKNNNAKRFWTAKAELERLQSEQAFKSSFEFSPDLIKQAKLDQDIRRALLQQEQFFNARMQAFSQEVEALQSRTEQIQQQETGLRQQIAILQEQISSINEEQQAFSTLFDEGFADGMRARELKRLKLTTKNEVARLESEVARFKIQKFEAELQIATRKQDFLKDIGERIKVAQGDYYQFQEALEIVSDRIERATIRSPEAGIVVDMSVHTIGSVAPAGQTLLDLVPLHDTYVVEAKILTQDINEVYLGQKADIRFSAFNSRVTKVIEGEVINVSADRLVNEHDGSPYYLVRIRVSEQGSKDLEEDMQLKPGMPAEVMIRRGKRTLFSYMLKPISDSFARSFKEK